MTIEQNHIDQFFIDLRGRDLRYLKHEFVSRRGDIFKTCFDDLSL